MRLRELLRQVSDDEPQPPRQLVQDIPPDLERVCLKALAKRLPDRYTTAADFAEDLRRVLQTAAVSPASWQAPVSTPTDELHGAPTGAARPDILNTSLSHRRVREAERRQVTILICGCDLFESQAYLELDSEDQAEVLRLFQQACNEAASRFDGTVVQCNEQGLRCASATLWHTEDGDAAPAWTGLGLLDDMKALGERLRRQLRVEAETHRSDFTPGQSSSRQRSRRSHWSGRRGT